VLDELGLDRQAVLELKFKAALRQKILQLVKRHTSAAVETKIPRASEPFPYWHTP